MDYALAFLANFRIFSGVIAGIFSIFSVVIATNAIITLDVYHEAQYATKQTVARRGLRVALGLAILGLLFGLITCLPTAPEIAAARAARNATTTNVEGL